MKVVSVTSTMAHRVRVRFCGVWTLWSVDMLPAAFVEMSPAAANSDLVVYIFVRHYSKLE